MSLWEGGGGEGIKGNKSQRLLMIENKLRVDGGEQLGGWAKQVMGIKEDTRWDEYWVLYVSGKSLNSTPVTNTALYVN